MLLKIDVNKDDIIFNEGGRIIVKVKYYAQFANAAHLCTLQGSTKDDFESNKNLSGKTVHVGQAGGITIS